MPFTRRQILLILALFFATRAVLTLVGAVMVARLPMNEGEQFAHLLDGGPALDMWYRWDAGFYATIATEGYDWFNTRQPADDMAFLPVYPLAVRAVMMFSGLSPTGCVFSPYLSTCATVAGLIVSNVALLGASFLLFDLARRWRGESTAWRALWLLLLSPGSIYLSGVYTEGTFLLLVLLAFWLLERDRFALAVGVACVAALTRSVGVALVPALLWVAWKNIEPPRRQERQEKTREDVGEGLLPPTVTDALLRVPTQANIDLPTTPDISITGGASPSPTKNATRVLWMMLALLPGVIFAGYVLGMGVYVGELLAYFRVYDTTWGHEAGSIIDAFTVYFSGQEVALYGWDLAWLDLFATLGYLALAVLVLRQRVIWGLFALFAILIPAASGTLVAMPRFGVVVFPFYLLIGAWLAQHDRRTLPALARHALVYGASAVLLLVIARRFVTWFWIA
jgi:hypothetical protein